MGAVREDVVKLGFDVDYAELNKCIDILNDIKKIVTGGVGDDAFDEMIKESRKAADGVDEVKKGLDGVNSDGVDDATKGLKNTKKNAEAAHGKVKQLANTSFDKTVSGLKKVASTLGSIALKAGKVLAKGLVAGVAGVGTLVTQSVLKYADYEQLVGGVDTLFKDSSGTVQKYADDAYKAAGLSANDYMETVTSFSASLIQSLGGDTGAAAELANMAIIDMSDNANKMGTDMSSIQDAYQGFAKQNYTMLDNLKLGYGGTQEEMKRLLKDAEAISGVKYDISSYADIVQAIHVIQENMDIAGTTSKEASETITGSWSSMKAAWSNTLTSLVLGGDDFDRCVDNLVDSAKTFAKNIMPAIQKALAGVGSLIEELAPIIEKELPGLIDTLLPPLIKAATSLVKGVIIALPDIIGTLVDELPEVLGEIWSGVKEAFGDMPGIKKAEVFFGKLQTFFEKSGGTLKKIIPAVLGVVAAFKVFNKLKGLTGLFGGISGGSGSGGGGLFSMFTNFAKIKPTTILKGLLNLAIILGGLGVLGAALMAVAPYMAQLSDLKSIAKVLLVISAVGLIGTAMATLSGSVGNIPVGTVVKGLANIAIVMVGFGALAAVLMWVAPYVAQLGDLKSIMKLLVMIGATALIGSALAGLAGVIGMIPIEVVLLGLANIATALAGFTAIVSAFAALSLIPGFNDFLNKGGEVLSTLCNIVGQMAGSLIGGIGEGITASLPAMGQNISDFATSIAPAFETFGSIDSSGLLDFAAAFGAFVLVLTGDQLLSAITGGIDYSGLGTKLSGMATSLSTFFATVMTFPEGCFEKASALFDCLANISSLPKEGGVVGWFQGEVDFNKIAEGMISLAGAADAFTAIQAIPDEAFTKMGSLFSSLANIDSLPKEGGVVGWFQGEVNFASIASGIQSLASEGMISALTTISGLPETAFTGLTSMFNALAGIQAMPKEGGIAGWFGGDSSSGLSNVASQLPGVATNIATFFTNLGGRTDFSPIKTLFDTLSSIKIDSTSADKGFLGLGSSEMQSMGQGLSDFASKAAGFFTAINDFDVEAMKSFFDELATVGELPDSLSSLDTDIGTALSTIVTTAETKMTEIKTVISTGLTGIIDTFTSSKTRFYSSGVAIMQGLKNGMLSMKPALLSTASTIANAISSKIDAALDIHSPSKVTFKTGMYTGEGMNQGMQSTIPTLKATANDMGLAAIPYGSNYSPESSTTYNSGGNVEYTTISPQFNLTISGSSDDRSLARKVRRYVSEGVQEAFESLERGNISLREA